MSEELVQVRLLGYPLDVWQRAQEHLDELLREFELILIRTDVEPGRREIPRRLLDLIARLRRTYSGVTAPTDRIRDEAHERGEATVDLTYTAPRSVRDAAVVLADVMAEVDEYCRRGVQLLTLATPTEAVAFRHWYLGEFIAQVGGAAPTPWSEYLERHPIAG